MSRSLTRPRLLSAIFSFTAIAFLLTACEMRLQVPSSPNGLELPAYEFEASGEDFLISALDEVQAIADWSDSFTNGPSPRLSELTAAGKKGYMSITGTDTVYIYGQIITGGYGAVVTERYARPKGLLLITVRKSCGKANGHIVTETKRYASYADHLADKPQQTNVTEIYGAQIDTIVTRVVRNGTLQTYTFRLPVISKVVNPQDGSIRITSRYALNGVIVSKTTDGNNNLVQLRKTYGESDGSSVSRTEYPDGSWHQVRTRGQADGTVLRETTSGLPSIGSGITAPPSTIPRPRQSMWSQTHRADHLSTLQSIASGMSVPGTTPRPAPNCRGESGTVTANKSLASGNQVVPAPPIRPPHSRGVPLSKANRFDHLQGRQILHQSFASGMAVAPVPPRPTLASGLLKPPPRPPRPTLASGVTFFPSPPRPALAKINCSADVQSIYACDGSSLITSNLSSFTSEHCSHQLA